MLASDAELDADACVGTLRWSKEKKFPALDELVVTKTNQDRDCDREGVESSRQIDLKHGWPGFFRTRCGSVQAVQEATKDLALVDGLSYPITAIHALENVQPLWENAAAIDIVVMGATYKAEVRLFRETSYWTEVERFFKQKYGKVCRLWFVGPELNPPSAVGKRGKGKKRNAQLPPSNCWQGGVRDFLRTQKPELIRSPPFSKEATVLIGFNPGFGSGARGLLESWLPDLCFIRDKGIPCIFTQANDFSDLRGEVMIARSLLKTRFLLTPSANPFHMAMTACADPRDPTSSSWSCGNSFFYAICGSSEDDDGALAEPPDATRIRVCTQLCQRFHSDLAAYPPDQIRLAPQEITTAWNLAAIAPKKLPDATILSKLDPIHDLEIRSKDLSEIETNSASSSVVSNNETSTQSTFDEGSSESQGRPKDVAMQSRFTGKADFTSKVEEPRPKSDQTSTASQEAQSLWSLD